MGIVKLVGTIIAGSLEIRDAINKTEKQAEGLDKKMEDSTKSSAKWGATIKNAVTGAGSAMMDAAKKVAGAAEEIDKSSKNAGADAETWQKLKYAMGESGISAENLETSMLENQQTLSKAASGVGEYTAAYDQLGVSIYDSSGKLKDSDDVFQESLRALADMEDLNQRNALANQIFGESYTELDPILKSGSEGIDELTSRAEELGLVMSQQSVDSGTKFGETLDTVNQFGEAMFNMVAVELLPVFQTFLDWILSNAPKIQEIVAGVAEVVRTLVSGFTEFWEEHSEQINLITQVIFDTLKGAIDALLAIINGDWKGAWEILQNVVANIINNIGPLVKAGIDSAISSISKAGSKLLAAGGEMLKPMIESVKADLENFVNLVSDGVNWLVDKLAFWRKSEDEMRDGNKKTGLKPRGSYSSGLAYVPYDRYPAELHRGEKVLTAEQAREYDERTSADAQSGGDTYIFNSPKALTPAEARRQMQKARKELLLGF